jgi:hypothetical protein
MSVSCVEGMLGLALKLYFQRQSVLGYVWVYKEEWMVGLINFDFQITFLRIRINLYVERGAV